MARCSCATSVHSNNPQVAADRERILGLVARHGGFDELNTRVGTAVYNAWRVMALPAVRDAVYATLPSAAAARPALAPGAVTAAAAVVPGSDPGGSLLHEVVTRGVSLPFRRRRHRNGNISNDGAELLLRRNRLCAARDCNRLYRMKLGDRSLESPASRNLGTVSASS